MILLYAQNITPRLQYIVDFFRTQLFDDPILITSDRSAFANSTSPKINYSPHEASDEEFYIHSTSLLFETGIRFQPIECFEINFHKAFFQSKGDLPFDIFAASFYLLSRYEEYLPFQADEYGRYPYTSSLAYKENFLHQPLVNIWVDEFKTALKKKYPAVIFKQNQFKCLVTYDIDIAYSYLHKGFKRNAGGLVRSIVSGDWHAFNARLEVLRGRKRDPFDCFEWLDALHLYCRVKPHYFFLVARSVGKYDKNISTSQKAFYGLIEYYSGKYNIGIHPSWQSGDDVKQLKEELEWLETVADRKIVESRQHYIRFRLPQTFRQLIDVGIRKDYSMGYGSINGFRASVCSSFYWYDLENELKTDLLILPFCFMDANSLYEQKHSPQQAYHDLVQYYEVIKKFNGTFVSVWHNSILGTDPAFRGWPEMFELFMKETVYWDAYYAGN